MRRVGEAQAGAFPDPLQTEGRPHSGGVREEQGRAGR